MTVATSDEQLDLLATAKPTPPNEPPPEPRCSQLTELPGVEFEHIFACHIDESAGLKEDAE